MSQVLLIVLIVCGCLVLICCGGGIFMAFWVKNQAQNMIVQDPAAVEAARREIAKVDVPEGFEPAMLFNMKLPFVGEMAKMVRYHRADQTGVMMLVQLSANMTEGQSPEQFAKQMQLQSGADAGMNPDDVVASSTETIERTIGGQPATFELAVGTNKDTNTEQIVVNGTFVGPNGPGLFMLQVNADSNCLPGLTARGPQALAQRIRRMVQPQLLQ
jgi:hypothetical protein